MNTKNLPAFSSGIILLNIDYGNILNNGSLSESSELSETLSKLSCKHKYLLKTAAILFSISQLGGHSLLEFFEDYM